MPDTAFDFHDPVGKMFRHLLTGEIARVDHVEPMIAVDGPQEVVIFEGGARVPKEDLHLFWIEMDHA